MQGCAWTDSGGLQSAPWGGEIHAVLPCQEPTNDEKASVAVGYKRPLSQHARMSMMVRPEARYRVSSHSYLLLVYLCGPGKTRSDVESESHSAVDGCFCPPLQLAVPCFLPALCLLYYNFVLSNLVQSGAVRIF